MENMMRSAAERGGSFDNRWYDQDVIGSVRILHLAVEIKVKRA